MIVDSPINYALAVGQDRIVPTEDDTKLFIPASLQPVVIAMQPTQIGSTLDALTTRRVFSTFAATEAIRAPLSGINQVNLMTLGKGYWELQMELTSQADFTGTPAAPSRVVSNLFYQSQNLAMMTDYHIVGVSTKYFTMRILLTDVAIVSLIQPATGAAQNLVSRLTVNAIKVL